MAEYSTVVVHVERHEFLVPTGPWGACWVEVYKAVRAAHQELWALGLVAQGKDASDDSIRMECRDDEIAVFYVLNRDGENVRLG